MRQIRFLIVIFIALLVGYYLGTNKVTLDWKNYHPQVQVLSKEPPPGISQIDMTQFWTVFQTIEDKYYDKTAVDPQKMLTGAISGMVNTLGDPYTVYLPPAQNGDFKQSLSGQFSGIGAELGLRDKQLIVVAPLDGSPASKAGLKAGDAILKVDSDSTQGWTLDQAVNKIRGPKGTAVALTVIPKNQTASKVVTITRDTITVKSVTSYVKAVKDIDTIKPSSNSATPAILTTAADEKVAYIRLSQFGDNTNQEWLSMANSLALSLDKDKSIKGVILDLRNNPGGYVTDAVFIASEFLPVGRTVVVEDMGGEQDKLAVTRKGLLQNVPLIVLINKGSASAAEITAGALRDNKRAILVGDNSYGKGIMQSAQDLGGGAGLHVTIAKWLTPDGTWVGNGKDGAGLTPDVKVALDSKDPSYDSQLEKAVEQLVK